MRHGLLGMGDDATQLTRDDLLGRLMDFDHSIEVFDMERNLPHELSAIFNALLDRTEDLIPGDPVVQTIKGLARFDGQELEGPDREVGVVRAQVKQMILALEADPAHEPSDPAT